MVTKDIEMRKRNKKPDVILLFRTDVILNTDDHI